MESGCVLSPDDIIITNGATEALHLCLRAVAKRGDTIAVESPTYFGVLQLIEDDIFGSLAYAPNRPRTAKSFDRQGLVLLCSAFTKTLAPGYRIGWTAPGRFKAAVHRLKHVCSCANPAVTQLAVAEFLRTGGYEHHLRRLRRTYAELTERMREAVARHFPPETRVTRPQGGHVL